MAVSTRVTNAAPSRGAAVRPRAGLAARAAAPSRLRGLAPPRGRRSLGNASASIGGGRASRLRTNAQATQYICIDCGYIYSGRQPFDELEKSYKCPKCLSPKRRFSELDPVTGKVGVIRSAPSDARARVRRNSYCLRSLTLAHSERPNAGQRRPRCRCHRWHCGGPRHRRRLGVLWTPIDAAASAAVMAVPSMTMSVDALAEPGWLYETAHETAHTRPRTRPRVLVWPSA